MEQEIIQDKLGFNLEHNRGEKYMLEEEKDLHSAYKKRIIGISIEYLQF